MTRIPCAMLMISITPKIKVNPDDISAYTLPVNIPKMTASMMSVTGTHFCPCEPEVRLHDPAVEERDALPRLGAYLLRRPLRFGVLRIRLRKILWIHRNQIPVLPLEKERDRSGVLAVRGELHGSLQRIERIRVQLLDELGVVNTVDFIDGLRQYLHHRVRLHRIRANIGGSATVLGDIVLLKLGVLEGVDTSKPATVGDKYALGILGTPDWAGELVTLVWAARCDEGLWIVVLLLKSFDVGDTVRGKGAQHHQVRPGGDHLLGVRCIVACLHRVLLVKDRFDAALLQQRSRRVQLWYEKRVVLCRKRGCLGSLSCGEGQDVFREADHVVLGGKRDGEDVSQPLLKNASPPPHSLHHPLPQPCSDFCRRHSCKFREWPGGKIHMIHIDELLVCRRHSLGSTVVVHQVQFDLATQQPPLLIDRVCPKLQALGGGFPVSREIARAGY